MPQQQKPLPVGTLLKGKYRISRLVAGGGMAWIYEVAETSADGRSRTWAMKELRADADDAHSGEEARQLFAGEANILVRLSHPNLPRVSAFFQEKGRSYLVMEFIRGESLQKRLDRANAPILETQALGWAIQICDVLAYLHSQPQPVIFRDMKPSNVMVTPDGQIKLIDFGIARTYKTGKSKDTITMGSENYAAPEQWGQAQTDPRADVYGLGATMYHLLTKVPPLPAFVPSPRVPVRQYNPAISEQTVAVVERALSHDRQNRPQSAAAMRKALWACLPRREQRRLEQRARRGKAPSLVTWQTPGSLGTSPAGPEISEATKLCPTCHSASRRSARFCRRCGYAFVPPLPPVLSVVRPEGARWEFPLRSKSVLVGRAGGELPVDLDLGYYDPEGYVSRNHARIWMDRRQYHLSDQNSSNGTFVNGQRLQLGVLHNLRQGDQIRIGQVVLQFRIR